MQAKSSISGFNSQFRQLGSLQGVLIMGGKSITRPENSVNVREKVADQAILISETAVSHSKQNIPTA